jgi:hypothetical protein
MAGEHHISAEEYRGWLEPSQVLASLPSDWSRDTKIRTIAKRLQDGLIRAVAETIVVDGEAESYLLIPRESWAGWAFLVDTDFWNAGDREVYGDAPEFTVAFRGYGVRLDPKAVSRLSPPGPRPEIEAIPPDPLASRDVRPEAEKSDDDARWLLAREAAELLAPLYDFPSLAREALIDLAAAGSVTTWCARYILPQPQENPALRINQKHHVPVGFWGRFDDAANRETEDWALGNFSVRFRSDLDILLAKALGVMFSENDLCGLRELRSAFSPSPPDQDAAHAPTNMETLSDAAPSVSPAEVDAWYTALTADDQALGHAKLWRKAKADHPGRKLVRKLIDPLVEGRPTGRKPTRR